MTEVVSRNAQLLYETPAVLGEGPVWDHMGKCLYWVDIEGCRLHCHDTAGNENTSWEFDAMPGALFPVEDGRLLLAMEGGFAIFDPATAALTPLNLLRNSDQNLRFNDGKCDPYGNIWIGTMHKELAPGAGNLYKIGKNGDVTKVLPRTTVSNGMAWSADHSRFYYSDTDTHELWSFKFDPKTATIADKKVCFTIPESFGGADGLCIDREGMLWIAHWGGHCVRRWDPDKGVVLQAVTVPAPHVTSCCFGGPSFNTLYITTARSGLGPRALKAFPLSGSLFQCLLPVAGYPTNYINTNTLLHVPGIKK